MLKAYVARLLLFAGEFPFKHAEDGQEPTERYVNHQPPRERVLGPYTRTRSTGSFLTKTDVSCAPADKIF